MEIRITIQLGTQMLQRKVLLRQGVFIASNVVMLVFCVS